MNDFYFESIDGGYINLGDFKGRPILITNTASNCGFTRQYNELQKLHDDFSESGLVVLAIPSQDFFQEFNDNDINITKIESSMNCSYNKYRVLILYVTIININLKYLISYN